MDGHMEVLANQRQRASGEDDENDPKEVGVRSKRQGACCRFLCSPRPEHSFKTRNYFPDGQFFPCVNDTTSTDAGVADAVFEHGVEARHQPRPQLLTHVSADSHHATEVNARHVLPEDPEVGIAVVAEPHAGPAGKLARRLRALHEPYAPPLLATRHSRQTTLFRSSDALIGRQEQVVGADEEADYFLPNLPVNWISAAVEVCVEYHSRVHADASVGIGYRLQ